MKNDETRPQLKPCQFVRGQVWSNPDDEFMMVTEISKKDDAYKVYYVTEDNQRGSFYSSDKTIVDNIKQVDTRADRPDPGLAEVREEIQGLRQKVPDRRAYTGSEGDYEIDEHRVVAHNYAIDAVIAILDRKIGGA